MIDFSPPKWMLSLTNQLWFLATIYRSFQHLICRMVNKRTLHAHQTSQLKIWTLPTEKRTIFHTKIPPHRKRKFNKFVNKVAHKTWLACFDRDETQTKNTLMIVQLFCMGKYAHKTKTKRKTNRERTTTMPTKRDHLIENDAHGTVICNWRTAIFYVHIVSLFSIDKKSAAYHIAMM